MIIHKANVKLNCCSEHMLYEQDRCAMAVADPKCTNCDISFIRGIKINGYAAGDSLFEICADCAKQLARKLLEDICDIDSVKGRYG